MNPRSLGVAFGATDLVFYLGCMLTMATIPQDSAVTFFNSLLPGLDAGLTLKTSVPTGQVVLGLATTFVLGWFAVASDKGIDDLNGFAGLAMAEVLGVEGGAAKFDGGGKDGGIVTRDVVALRESGG